MWITRATGSKKRPEKAAQSGKDAPAAGSHLLGRMVVSREASDFGPVTLRYHFAERATRVARPFIIVDDASDKMIDLRPNVRSPGMRHHHAQEMLHFHCGHAQARGKNIFAAPQFVVRGQPLNVGRLVE